MPTNLLEQLEHTPIPAPPPKLRADVRERMNTTLVALQIADFALRGVPFAIWHFAHAVAGLLAYTMTGTYEPRIKNDARRD